MHANAQGPRKKKYPIQSKPRNRSMFFSHRREAPCNPKPKILATQKVMSLHRVSNFPKTMKPCWSRNTQTQLSQISLLCVYNHVIHPLSRATSKLPSRESHDVILLSLSSQALQTPPPKTLVCRRHPSPTTISPLTSMP